MLFTKGQIIKCIDMFIPSYRDKECKIIGYHYDRYKVLLDGYIEYKHECELYND